MRFPRTKNRWLLGVLPALVGCTGGGDAGLEGVLVIGAATSLTGVVEDAIERWNAERGTDPRVSLGSSSTVARQIEQGAPFDLFLSADEHWIDYLVEGGLVDSGTRRTLARNHLVGVRPRGSDFEFDLPEVGEFDATEPRAAYEMHSRGPFRMRFSDELELGWEPASWATGDPAHVPLGRYALAALTSMGLFEELEPTLLAAGDARAALRLVARREVDWGLLYRTDALVDEAVEIVFDVDPQHYPPILYEGVVVAGADERALPFLEWLAGECDDIFGKHGFSGPEIP
ncbi:MAG: molybdate ABC transporter substrate-binding protein [Planctomycetota bacterium]|jgi:molybdate transport system substrate-binding protein